MPCREIFETESKQYRDEVLPPDVKARISVEAAATLGWERFTGDDGVMIGIDRFGSSAKGELNMEKFGFTAGNIIKKARELTGMKK